MSDELIELPEGWETATIGEVIIPYKTTQPIKEPEKEFRYIDIGSINNSNQTITITKNFLGKDAPSRARRVVKKDDVLFSTVRTYLKNIARVPTELDGVLTSTGIAVLRAGLDIDSNFLFYWVASDKFIQKISKSMDGTLYPAITDSDIFNAEIPLPPLNEQKRIVAKIEELNDRTQRAKEALETIPQLCDRFRQSVLAAAFRGDLTADWREQNPDVEPASKFFAKVKDERQKNYYQEIEELRLEGKNIPKLASFEEIAIDLDIPATWISISVESACLFIVDCLHSTPKFMDEGEYCIDTTCIEPFKINWDKARKVNTEDFTIRTSRMLPRQNDILFSREGTIGTAVRVPNSPKLCLGQRMMMFRFSPQIVPEYAELYLQSPIFQERYKSLILGTTSPHLNIGDIRKLAFLVPPLAEQRQILRQASSLLKVTILIGQQYDKLKTLLDKLNQSILAKAFRGELVPQDPDDEPASVLLERIRAEREKLNNGKQKSQRTSKRKSKTIEEQEV